MKIIYGAVRPDEGVIRWNGWPVNVKNPEEARALGIAMVFQHFSLFDRSRSPRTCGSASRNR